MTQPDPLLERLHAGLQWPPWPDWPSEADDEWIALEPAPVDHNARRAELERRLGRARLVADGGPYVEIFDSSARDRIDVEAGRALGPLAEFSFAIKDLVAVEGRTLGAGSAVRADAAPETRSATIVRQLESLGAIAVGAAALHEFAFGVTGVNAHSGTPDNPAAPGRVPGGSSSGSAAAVADGSARIAIGTDTGGSVRIPAAFCGVAGFKPAAGTYSAAGVFPLSITLDHVGFLATTARDLVVVHGALGHDVHAPRLPHVVGVARADLEGADPDVREATEHSLSALEAAGVELRDVSWPDAEEAFVASTTIMYTEAAAVHAPLLAEHGDRYGADIAARLRAGAALSGPEVAAAHRLRQGLIRKVRSTLHTVDVIVGPTVPIVAPSLEDAGDPALPARIVANTRLGNVVGLPIVSIPQPTSGPPIGLQITGATNADVLAAVSAIEPILAGAG